MHAESAPRATSSSIAPIRWSRRNESVLREHRHGRCLPVQTILAYEARTIKPLPIANGAPIRLRVERQLGYKHAKYVMRIELVESFDEIAGGKGGYWEDQGYEWYAGI